MLTALHGKLDYGEPPHNHSQATALGLGKKILYSSDKYLGDIMKIKEYFLRTLRFYWERPTAPSYQGGFNRPVVVVGSAPISTAPLGFDASYHVITINGSQVVSRQWGREKPDVTFMTSNQLQGQNTNAISVRGAVGGCSTRLLIMTLWSRPLDELKLALQKLEYSYDELKILTRMERMALHHAALGKLNLELTSDDRFSNGITGVLFALASGAPAVITSGINPLSSGHVYNDANLQRRHSGTDAKTLRSLVERGYPVYTADSEVGHRIGIPIWNAPKTEREC